MTIAIALLLVARLVGAAPATDDAAQQFSEISDLVAHGRLDEATRRLADATLPEGARHRLAGWIALRRGELPIAIDELERALAIGPDDPTLRLYLASARLEHGDPRGALETLAGTESLATSTVAQPLLHARVLTANGNFDEAYRVLQSAATRFPNDQAPQLEAMALCASQQLPACARSWAEQLGDDDSLDRDTALAIFAATWRDRNALPLLERLAGRWPDDAELTARLAHAWSAQQKWYAAARLFETATRRGGDYAFEAADQYRLAGFDARALALNAEVTDPRRRLGQRIDILFAAGKYARVVALAASAADVGLDDAVRMRIAHAHWQLGQHVQATAAARALLDSSEATSARALLRAMGRTD